MSASPFDSAIYHRLFNDTETATLFSDTAELRAILLTWGALAIAQAKHGLIPETAAKAIQRAAMEIQVDPAALANETMLNGVVVPGLLAQFREEMKAPEHAAFVHFGATSQDIIDTGLSLRLRQVLGLTETRLKAILTALADQADTHAATPIAARTWGHIATPTSFGAVIASWGNPLLALLRDIDTLRKNALPVSLSGAAGTLSVMQPNGSAIRADFAKGLGLFDPGHSWHSQRECRTRLSSWMVQVTAQLGKMGEDLVLLSSSAQREVQLPISGGSSTMPQKQNPVQPALLATLARHNIGLNATMQNAALHKEQRDGAAWMLEWLALPQICCGTVRALSVAQDLATGIIPNTHQMLSNIDAENGLIYAEALSFRLAQNLPRPKAQAVVKQLCEAVTSQDNNLEKLAKIEFPDVDLDGVFHPDPGSAPTEARSFVKAARVAAKHC